MGTAVTRAQAAGLGILAALLLLVAWLTDPPTGPVVALAGGVLGWIVCRMTPRVLSTPTAPEPAAIPTSPQIPTDPEAVAAPAEAQGSDEWTHKLSLLRHDLRGILSPAMLIADRLLAHEDPAVQRAGELVNRTVERAAARLADKPG
jgi:hypothetical protein